jgi:hypothetical protein
MVVDDQDADHGSHADPGTISHRRHDAACVVTPSLALPTVARRAGAT